jgi:hypothetical protein
LLIAATLLFVLRYLRVTLPYVKYDLALAIFLLAVGGWGPPFAQDIILDSASLLTDGFRFSGLGADVDFTLNNFAVEDPSSHLCLGRALLPLTGPHRRGAWRFGPRGHYYCGAKPQWWPVWLLVTSTFVGISMLISQVYRAVQYPLTSVFLGRARAAFVVALNTPSTITNYRNLFRKVNVRQEPVEDPSHTHPKAAAARNSALATASHYAQLIGIAFMDVQQSASSFLKFPGSKIWFWATDALVPQRPIGPGVIFVNDTDYHADMPELLSSTDKPVLIGTLNPECAAKTTDEYMYTFNPDGSIVYEVAGGAKFEHFLWDYNHDHVRVVSNGLLWQDHTTWNVERKYLDDDHELVCLVPEVRQRLPALWSGLWLLLTTPFFGWWAVAASGLVMAYSKYVARALAAPLLERIQPVVSTTDQAYPHVTVLRVQRTGAIAEISVGVPGKFSATTVPLRSFDSLVMSASVKNPPTLARVRNVLQINTDVEAAPVSAVASVLSPGVPTLIQKVLAHVVPVSAVIAGQTPDEKAAMEDFGSGLVNGGNYHIMRSPEGDAWTIQERIEQPRKSAPPAKVTPFLALCIQDFVGELLKGRSGTLHPVGHEVVRAKQNRPTQQHILDAADGTTALVDTSRPLQSFQKAETVSVPKANRNITTFDPPSKAAYSQYMYAVHDYMVETQEWYCPGRTPAEIARRVADIATKASIMNNADASKLDARISEVNRALERAVMFNGFSEEYHSDLLVLAAAQKDRNCVTMFNQKYKQGDGRGSGSAETTVFNTTDTGFHVYLGFRNKKIDGEYMDHQTAWQHMSTKLAAFGDDATVADLPAENLERAGRWVGHVYKSDVISRGGIGVNFLARYYTTDVWHGSPNSCCSLLRVLPKLYTSTRNQLTPAHRLDARLRSYALMDPNTPVIGTLVKKYVSEFGGFFQEGDSWWAQYEMEKQWPNEPCDNFMDYANAFLPGFDWEGFSKWVEGLDQDYDKWLSAPVFCTLAPPPAPAVRAVVGNDLIPGPEVVVRNRQGKPSAKSPAKTKAAAPPKDAKKRVNKAAGVKPGAKSKATKAAGSATEPASLANSNNSSEAVAKTEGHG